MSKTQCKTTRLLISSLVTSLLIVFAIDINCALGTQHSPSKNKVRRKFSVPLPPVKKKTIKTKEVNWEFQGPLREKFQIDDHLLSNLKDNPPRSAWIESEKQFYQGLLSGKIYDVLVVPFQTKADGVDIVGRMLMSYHLAKAIEQNTNLKVAPLALVYPALGRLARYYNEDEVRAFAKEIGVKRVIWGFAGTREYPDPETVQFSFSIIDQSGDWAQKSSSPKFKSWPYQSLTPDVLPSQVFAAALAEVSEFLQIPYKKPEPLPTTHLGSTQSVPESPKDILKLAGQSPIYQSYILQMMAMLAPAEYEKKYLFTRSLINVFSIDPNNPDRRIIEARAYIHLYRRPAALKAIEGIHTTEAEALIEYINANLPEMQTKVGKLEPSIRKFLLNLDLFYLRNKYKQRITDAEKKRFIADYPDWHHLLSTRLSHYDSWDQFSNIELQLLLDSCFPISGFSLDKYGVGHLLTHDDLGRNLKLEMMFQKHIRLSLENLKEELAAVDHRTAFHPSDMLVMFDSVGLYNLRRFIHFRSFTQGMPDEGLRICNDILYRYSGHPYFEATKAMVLNKSARGKSEMEKKNLMNLAYASALDAMWWNGCQNWVHRYAKRVLTGVFKDKKLYISSSDLDKGILQDYPFRTNNVEFTRRSRQMLMQWAHTDIVFHSRLYNEYVMPHIQPQTDKINAILKDLSLRFNGNPKKKRLLLKIQTAKNGASAKKKALLKEVAADSQDWDIYHRLARLYFVEEDYKAAGDILMRYPYIQRPNDFNSVHVSNKAYKAGELLFWQGASALARPFYQLSADLKTGSAASLQSHERLAVLDKDYSTALEYSFKRARRYDSSSGYNNHMVYLHLTGSHDMAWSLFQASLGQYDDPNIWDSAFVGHRIEGTTQENLNTWIKQMAMIHPSETKNGNIAKFGTWCLIDRPANPQILKVIEAIDDPSAYKNKGLIKVKSQVPSFGTEFAKAYEFLKQKNYTNAYSTLENIKRFYNLFIPFSPGYSIQSYFAWAGVKAGHGEKINLTMIKRFSRRVTNYDCFDKHLTIAAYEGAIGNHKIAITHLKKAFATRKYVGNRTINRWYQLLELCNWLYQDSGNREYAKLALKWSRIVQVIQPMYAWAYAIEANFTEKPKEKIRALAIATYLDPQSELIARFNTTLKAKAAKWINTNKPFILKPKGSNSDQI